MNIWYNGYTGANSSLVAYGFNNVMYDLNSSNFVDIASHSCRELWQLLSFQQHHRMWQRHFNDDLHRWRG